jgi:hypothetical protein
MPVVLIAVVLFVVALLAFAATRPGAFRVERSAAIQAPAGKIFLFIANFHNWSAWSPWEHVDPNLKRTFSGAESGTGAVYEWLGNSKAGQGRMEILQARPDAAVVIKLDFIKPFEGHNTAEFTLEPRGDSTLVTWAIYGPSSFPAKLMSVFISMDKMLGKEFERGLSNLKNAVEK